MPDLWEATTSGFINVKGNQVFDGFSIETEKTGTF
jgi:hypothetical protein